MKIPLTRLKEYIEQMEKFNINELNTDIGGHDMISEYCLFVSQEYGYKTSITYSEGNFKSSVVPEQQYKATLLIKEG